ncbi:hypothetical protein RRG08_002739 [Elysia crispata]|uniref:Uncharacterized protein n=1 Tax=Elysia crispata TaxID=231223 RepID=A0AAE0XU25_9GAST|nr:hypothetical protein RRG08_002739 [Elysia crispata]
MSLSLTGAGEVMNVLFSINHHPRLVSNWSRNLLAGFGRVPRRPHISSFSRCWDQGRHAPSIISTNSAVLPSGHGKSKERPREHTLSKTKSPLVRNLTSKSCLPLNIKATTSFPHWIVYNF